MPVPAKKLAAFMQNEASKSGKKFPPFGKGGPGREDNDQGEEGAAPGKDYSQMVEEEAKRLADGRGDSELLDLMTTFDPEDNPPEWAAQPDVWMKAEEAVDPEGAGATYDEPYAVVAHVYKRMGGKVRK